jgi:hypothetical protein
MLVPQTRVLSLKLQKLKSYNLPGSVIIPAELIQTGGSISSVILFGIWKNFLISGRSLLLKQFTGRSIKLNVVLVIIVGYHCYQLYPMSLTQG